ncbi:hypothetical protein Ahy_A06g030615 isoform A [Arachis hypogaea]|uniref:ER membrane protein complex subunit 4 n=1 Tax=Arachis hypogaea TaxID=3818 RepID=A0A445CWT9_ARAHY|nr:hypothetical protein Ahy_A06g030615 isoform A [Arachis hypogaea]
MDKGKGVMGSNARRWAVDFSDNSTSPSSRDVPDPPGFSRASIDQDDSTLSRQKKDAESNWKSQKAWEVAQAPFKNLLMMGFMMWMAGSTVHLFSIGITFSALWQPISALQSVGKSKIQILELNPLHRDAKSCGKKLLQRRCGEYCYCNVAPAIVVVNCNLKPWLLVIFEPYKDSRVELLGPKLLFIALNLGGLALGVWKLNALGLLPTHTSDWVSSLPPAQEVEYSGGGLNLR